jgi:phosphoribosylamine--glycine ligase
MAEREKNILIIDAGGRGQATAKHLRQNSTEIGNIYLAPGNGGTMSIDGASNSTVNPMNNQEVVEAALEYKIDLVFIAPEDPLANGLVDALSASGINAFGPTRRAAQIEWDKAWAMKVLEKYGICVPKFAVHDNPEAAHKFIDHPPDWGQHGLVVKVNDLVGGKGAFVCDSPEAAHEAVSKIMEECIFGQKGKTVVIQEKLMGVEVSPMAITDGERYIMLPFSEDHKQAYDGDKGDMTGGMGVRAPHPLVTRQLSETIAQQFIKPIIQVLAKEGRPFKGILYPALFITEDERIVLIEVNGRPGGPEWETVLRLTNTDIYPVLYQTARGNLEDTNLKFSDKHAILVVLASKGYPDKYETGKEICGLDQDFEDGVEIYHAGTKRRADGICETAGGRVAEVTAVGDTFVKAYDKAYRAVDQIDFKGKHFRRDIGRRRDG